MQYCRQAVILNLFLDTLCWGRNPNLLNLCSHCMRYGIANSRQASRLPSFAHTPLPIQVVQCRAVRFCLRKTVTLSHPYAFLLSPTPSEYGSSLESLERTGVSWIIAGSQPSTGLLAIGVHFVTRPAKSAEPLIQG